MEYFAVTKSFGKVFGFEVIYRNATGRVLFVFMLLRFITPVLENTRMGMGINARTGLLILRFSRARTLVINCFKYWLFRSRSIQKRSR